MLFDVVSVLLALPRLNDLLYHPTRAGKIVGDLETDVPVRPSFTEIQAMSEWPTDYS
jgi:hypothetical protein